MTQTDTHIPFVFRAYIVFVAGMVACYFASALLPFALSGAWTFSYGDIYAQSGVPGYPLDAPGALMVLLSGLFAPIVSFPPLLVWGPMLLRGELAPAVRRVLLPAMVTHGLYLVLVLTYGQTIMAWILD